MTYRKGNGLINLEKQAEAFVRKTYNWRIIHTTITTWSYGSGGAMQLRSAISTNERREPGLIKVAAGFQDIGHLYGACEGHEGKGG